MELSLCFWDWVCYTNVAVSKLHIHWRAGCCRRLSFDVNETFCSINSYTWLELLKQLDHSMVMLWEIYFISGLLQLVGGNSLFDSKPEETYWPTYLHKNSHRIWTVLCINSSLTDSQYFEKQLSKMAVVSCNKKDRNHSQCYKDIGVWFLFSMKIGMKNYYNGFIY